ncbi:hypothetical protein DSO57_1000646 [Entomophthora muscae]|uniref:Uncharacterized protein n=1 Tax=Entomophthora muscae TaxID=34485 RepID=A0ACC2TWZ4_9FUNG|nr:hypothetical protein DSO57_1000646 [Entomophthora muscae]
MPEHLPAPEISGDPPNLNFKLKNIKQMAAPYNPKTFLFLKSIPFNGWTFPSLGLVSPSECKVLWPTFGPRSGCISQTIKKGGPRAGKTPPKPGGLGSHGRQTLCVGLPGLSSHFPFGVPSNCGRDINLVGLLVVLVLPGPETISKPTKNAGHMKLKRSNLRPGEIGYQNLRPEVSQVANSSSPGVPWPKTIGFQSSPVETSEEGIKGNAHPESSEGS